ITPKRWRRGWDSNPRYVAVYTLSKRAPSAARPPLQSLLLPPLAEELPQDRAALLGEDAAGHRDAVVEARVANDVEERVHRARLRIRDAVNQAVDARVDQSAGAHRARLQGRVHGRSGEPPATERPRGLLQGEDLGVAGRIAQ